MIEAVVDNIATGGDGVARDPDGRVLFIPGALPGERVSVEVVSAKKRFARGRLIEVLDPHEHRIEPPCRHLAEGCGGCDFQHVAPTLALDLKAMIVADAIERIGRIANPPVVAHSAVKPGEYRTTMRFGVTADGTADAGRLGLRERFSHGIVVTPACLIAHPAVAEIVRSGRFPHATEVLVRVGARTGEAIVVVDPRLRDHAVPAAGAVGLISLDVVGSDRLDEDPGLIHEVVCGRRWQVSARSFFQSGPEAAELLVDTVGEAVGDGAIPHLVDLYSGVGLFAGSIGEPGRITAVEHNAAAVADAAVNLADRPVDVVECAVQRWQPEAADVVIADPSRRGLGVDGVAVVAGTGAHTVVLVSCDAGALGRDAGLLAAAGYRLDQAVVLDLFPRTSHVETVARFRRT